MRLEGGFQGRPNKLVDGCYSFWIGAVFPLLPRSPPTAASPSSQLFQSCAVFVCWLWATSAALHGSHSHTTTTVALQEYVLLCCQSPAGGLRDKPSKGRDFYHTCYCLSGLSSAQHGGSGGGDDTEPLVVGDREANLLCATDPVHNVCTAKVTRMLAHAFPAL